MLLGICSVIDTNWYHQNSIDTDTGINIGALLTKISSLPEYENVPILT